MMNQPWLELKILTVVFGTFVFLQTSQGFSFDSQAVIRSNTECGDAIKSLDQSPILDSQSIDQKIQNLSELKLSLDLAKVNGTSDIDVTAMKANYEIKERILVDYLAKHKIMSRTELIGMIKLKILELQRQSNFRQKNNDKTREEETRRKKEQEKEIRNSVVDGSLAISHRIKPGSFKMGKAGKEVDVTLTKPFDMMATATTQLFYRRVAELANTRFPGKYKITADPSQFKGDSHPVERVSYEDVQLWINALNELSKIGEPLLQELIPNHKQGDVYRLPTEAEWEFVAKGRGTLNGKYHFGDNEADLKDYAWHEVNSAHTTHPVAQKLPLVIDGKEFFDMHGNVSEWVADAWDSKAPLQGGVDPVSHVGQFRVLRGGSWGNSAQFLRSAYRNYFSPGNRYDSLGFRLVRTVP